jgi:hypothetical protein
MKPSDIEVDYEGDRLTAYIPLHESDGRRIKHDPRVWAALDRIRESTTVEQDLETLDYLYGRKDLPDDPTPEDIKKEAMRQVVVEFSFCAS